MANERFRLAAVLRHRINPRGIARRALRWSPAVYRLVKLATMLASYVFRQPHDPDFAIFRFAPEHGLFVDVGANAGQSALSFRIFNKTCRVLSFEVNPALENDLRLVQLRLRRFEYCIIGLADAEGEAQLTIPRASRTTSSQGATLEPEFLTGRIREISAAIGEVAFDNVTVPTATLDSFGLAPDAIKIDVEGAEYRVLVGMTETLARSQPTVLIETRHGRRDALALLRDAGYVIYVYMPRIDRLVPYPHDDRTLNAVCIHPSREAEFRPLFGAFERGKCRADTDR